MGIGVVLWRAADVSRLAAALFISVLPMVGVMIAIGLPAGAMEIPLVLGAAALGYQLWEDPVSTPTTDVTSTSSHST